jgi:hypothetical protein
MKTLHYPLTGHTYLCICATQQRMWQYHLLNTFQHTLHYICGSHSGDYEEYGLLGCNAVRFVEGDLQGRKASQTRNHKKQTEVVCSSKMLAFSELCGITTQKTVLLIFHINCCEIKHNHPGDMITLAVIPKSWYNEVQHNEVSAY